MARPKHQICVITKKDDPKYVKVAASLQESLEITGPEYERDGYVISAFEKVQETYYAPVDLSPKKEED